MGLRYGEQSLDILAVVVASKYEVTDSFADYIESVLFSTTDIGFRIAALGALSRRGDDRAIRLLLASLELVENDHNIAPLAAVAQRLVRRSGYRGLYHAYHLRDAELSKTLPSQWASFSRILRNSALRNDGDPFAALLIGEIESREQILALESVLELSRIWPKLGEAVVGSSLARVYRNSYKFGVPWYVDCDAPDFARRTGIYRLPLRKGASSGTAMLSNDLSSLPIDADSVEAVLLLQAVSTDVTQYVKSNQRT